MTRIISIVLLMVANVLPLVKAVGAAEADLPTLFIIGDSTLKNGSGKGEGGLWGWGAPIADYFDQSKIKVENRALGGRSSRTYLTEGLWDKVLSAIKPG